MPLKTLVKVGSITNLSDARYCAGMGVEMLGFSVIPGQPNFLGAKQFQEIRGWVTGIRVVAELYGIKSATELPEIIDSYKPDLLEMGAAELALFKDLPLPFILNSSDSGVPTSGMIPAYLIGTSEPPLSTIPFLQEVNSLQEVSQALGDANIKGIAMKGNAEIRPGLKEYEIAEILELLDSD